MSTRSNTLPALSEASANYENADQRRSMHAESGRPRTIIRGIRFGKAAVAYSSYKKIERPALTPSFDISA